MQLKHALAPVPYVILLLAVVFLMFAPPLPDNVCMQLTRPLRQIDTRVSAAVISMVPKMRAEASGTVVDYIYRGRAGTLDLERVCSGVRLLMTTTALGVAMAFVNKRAPWQRVLMIMACIPISLVCNTVHVTTTGFSWIIGVPALATGTPHMILEVMMLGIAFCLYATTSYVLNHLSRILRRIHRSRIPPGHCRKCGYNLTGNVSGICPECGERI